MTMRPMRVAIAGFGIVGRSIADLLLARRTRYRELYGVDARIVSVCSSDRGSRDEAALSKGLFELEGGLRGADFIASTCPDVVIEAGPSDFRTGGPGLAYIRSALSSGRDAIVVSKGALAFDGPGLRALARSTGSLLRISGATGAALPTIDLLEQSLLGCRVTRIDGILNATTNLLLDTMMEEGVGVDQALSEAQRSGTVERDSRDDVEGWDAACKLLILANFALGTNLSMKDLSVGGIEDVTVEDILGCRAAGVVPRLVASLLCEGGSVRGEIGLRVLAADHPLARVRGKNKAVIVQTDDMGEITMIGCGLEPRATAAAALKDLEHVIRCRSSAELRSLGNSHHA